MIHTHTSNNLETLPYPNQSLVAMLRPQYKECANEHNDRVIMHTA